MFAAELAQKAGVVQARTAADPKLRPTYKSKLEGTHEALIINQVVLHLCKTLDPDGDVSGGHWRIFLGIETPSSSGSTSTSPQQKKSPKSVELNFARQFTGPVKCEGYLEVTPRMYDSSIANEVAKVIYAVQPKQLTVGTAEALLLGYKRDQYRFNSDGIGCSYWVVTVIADLENAGFLPKGTREHAEAFIVANGPKTKLPAMVSKGTFY